MNDAEKELQQLAQEVWAWRTATQPDSHDDVTRVERAPDELPDWSPDAMARRRLRLRELARSYRALDLSEEPVPARVNGRLIGSVLARAHWELDLLRSWQRNPCFYIDQSLVPVYNFLLRPASFTPARSGELVRLVERVPQVLRAATLNITEDAARPFAGHALRTLESAGDALGQAMETLAAELPAAWSERLSDASQNAQRALSEYRSWIEGRLSGFTGSPSVGPEAFRFFLHRVALLPYTVAQLRDIGRREHERAMGLSLALLAGRSAPATQMFGNVDEQIARQRDDEAAMRRFYQQRGLMRFPNDLREYSNTVMPAYLEPLTWLGVPHYMATPGRADENAVRYVPEPRADLPYFQRAEARDPRVGIAHEGVHAWQAALSWQHPDPIRRQYYDSSANEGIAYYNEELLLHSGLFADSPDSAHFVVDAMRLRALRVEVDIRLALGELTLDEAADLLATRASVDDRTARDEALFFAGQPGQGLSYQVGKAQVLELLTACAEKHGSSFQLAGFHEELWREGNVPFALRHWEVLGARDQMDEAERLGGGEGPPIR